MGNSAEKTHRHPNLPSGYKPLGYFQSGYTFALCRYQRTFFLRYKGCRGAPVPLSPAPIQLRKPCARHERNTHSPQSRRLPSAPHWRRSAPASFRYTLHSSFRSTIPLADRRPKPISVTDAPAMTVGSKGDPLIAHRSRKRPRHRTNLHPQANQACAIPARLTVSSIPSCPVRPSSRNA
jgi:hypothetical protein